MKLNLKVNPVRKEQLNLVFSIYLFIYFLERGGREKERERNAVHIDRLPLARPQLATWPAIQAYALTGTQTGNLLVCSPALNPLSHTSQDELLNLGHNHHQ